MRERRKSQTYEKGSRKSKTRRLSVTCKRDSTSSKAEEEEEDSMDIDPCLLPNENSPTSQDVKKRKTEKPKKSAYTTLRDNNKALATALEDTQLELRLVRSENIQLKQQFHDSHQLFVEKTCELERQLQSIEQHSTNNVPTEAQAVFHDVYKILNKTCTEFLQGSNSLSEALCLVSSLLTPSKGQKHNSPHVVYNNVSPYVPDPACTTPICTTPPPDEPSAMEITATQSIVIETNDTVLKNLDTGLQKDLPFEYKHIDIKVENDIKAMQDSQSASRRAKRKSCTNISYVEPGLRSKLRRGDPHTDSTLLSKESVMKKRKRKKSLPVMGGTKKRAPLGNLTNILVEESTSMVT